MRRIGLILVGFALVIAACGSAKASTTTAPRTSGLPSAGAGTTNAAAVGAVDQLCDSFVTPTAIASALGAPVTKRLSSRLVQDLYPDVPADVFCQWLTADGSTVLMNVNYYDNGFHAGVKVPANGGATVSGVGDMASYLPDTLYFVFNTVPATNIDITGSHPAAGQTGCSKSVPCQPFSEAVLVALAKQVTAPAPASIPKK